MELKLLKPTDALNKAFRKVKPNRIEIEGFKTNLIQLLDRISETESEEFHKNLVADFLKDTYYKDKHFINTKGRNDQVIHLDNTPKSDVGVIIEAKKPSNKAEMLTVGRLNVKAFQELVLYYLRERIAQKNTGLKYLIATNIYEWFIFDAQLFERLFAENKALVRQFTDFEEKRAGGDRTDFFYKNIAAPFIDSIAQEVTFTHFDLHQYEKPLRNTDKADDNKLIALFKLLSPEHLLKLPFVNDSNSLDKRFYAELLHIIGLEETKDGGKKLIGRKAEGQRNEGSLLENAIIEMDGMDKLSRLHNPSQFGATRQERLFNVGLQLGITWVNRILFLKLLEAQLVSYHKGDKAYRFLNAERIRGYDELNRLFFQVLAKRREERTAAVRDFDKVPYLNSSLFEASDLEQDILSVNMLSPDSQLPVHSGTVLKDARGKKLTGQLPTLHYLLAFLDAYDFSSEGAEEIQEDNKTLINASVLGLIFEKINGYKDGSFFTPGFITMYMCRETLRRAVMQKFNEAKGWECTTLVELHNKITDLKEANIIMNSLRVCDPAVGSGHFLVSALNELIAIKQELGILTDAQGKTLRGYNVEVVNDELTVTDSDGQFFDYSPQNKESQRVQETLFHEKQTLIENCLFGVDINPNSVKICRLRLWIELLKNAYYGANGELETLPNIDINIKVGNSLISRFGLDADLGKALKKSKWNISSYRLAVDTYRNAKSKDEKRAMEELIATIKTDFRTEITQNDPKAKRLYKVSGELTTMSTQTQLFDMSKGEKMVFNKKVAELAAESKKLEAEIEEIKNNKIYENAFEWRFEFPEVLNDNGDFVGFDVVIGNPPYLSSKDFDKSLMSYLSEEYETSQYQLDLYVAFMELGTKILRGDCVFSFITPNSWLKNMTFSSCRMFMLENLSFLSIFPNLDNVFDEASVDTSIFVAEKGKVNRACSVSEFVNQNAIVKHSVNQSRFHKNSRYVFDVEISDVYHSIIQAVREKSIELISISDITRGVNPYDKARGQDSETIKNRAYHSSEKLDETFVPEIRGKHLSPYSYTWDGKHYISYGPWLAAPREAKYFSGKRILMRQILGEKLICTAIDENIIIDQSIFIAKLSEEYEACTNAVTVILGSKLLSMYFKFTSNEFDALFPKIKIGEFKELPVPKEIDRANSVLNERATRLLAMKKASPQADTTALEAEIDGLVYGLYGLTEEEIAIVENS